MRAIKQIFCMLICACLICAMISCKEQSNKGLLDTVLTTEEQQYYKEFLENNKIKHPGKAWPERVLYHTITEDFDIITKVGVKGLPVLIVKSIDERSEEEVKSDYFDGFDLAAILVDVFSSVSRIDSDFFYDPNKHIIDIPENYYVFWKYAKEELPKIYSSDMSADEKLDKYVKFGLFAVPYVKEEIAGGQSEYEKYFALVGAHLTTADYMKVINSPDTMTPMPTEEEIESSLLESAKDFDYKQWLAENEEDLNNLFKFFDEYVKEYEAKAENQTE